MEKAISRETIKYYAKELKLPTFNNYESVVEGLGPNDGYAEFLAKVMRIEKESRDEKGRENRIRSAGFPLRKSFDELDLSRFENEEPARIRELGSCGFVSARENIVMFGNPGTGKTHLAIALGIRACQKGFRVRFFTAADLLTQMDEARTEKKLARFTSSLQKVDLVIIDELSYMTLDRYKSELFFKVISDRSERKSTIITTNVSFSDWETIFGDKMMVNAIVGRLMFKSHAVNTNCANPYREEFAGATS